MEHNDLLQARELIIEAMGKQSSFWGLGKTVGEIFAVLYLSTVPLTLAEIAENLKVTKGNVSVSVRGLERLGMVRRTWQRGDRKVYFEAETDLWKVSRNVLSQRQKPEFDYSFSLVEKSLQMAKKSQPTPEQEEIVRRLNSIVFFYKQLDSLVAAVLKTDPAHLPALANFISGMARVKGRRSDQV